MALKLFTPEEMEELRSNKYTRIVEKDHISFTPEFREDFWDLYKGGISPVTIMESMGYKPEVLGRKRIYGIACHIKEQAQSPEGLNYKKKKPVVVTEKDCEQLSPTATIRKLQHEVEYLRQEIEFLKKIARQETQRKQKV